MIKIDIKVGDTILTGKWKNKKVVVKSIGTDEYGSPTINGKSILKIRIPKLYAKESVMKLTDLLKEGLDAQEFKNLSISDMRKQFPYKDSEIISIAKNILKRLKRNGKVKYNSLIDSDNTRKYNDFANLQLALYIELNDSGASDTTSGGTYIEQKGISVSFNLRGYWKIGKDPEFSMNASYTGPTGLTIYKNVNIKSKKDIENYMTSVINDLPKSKYQNRVY